MVHYDYIVCYNILIISFSYHNMHVDLCFVFKALDSGECHLCFPSVSHREKMLKCVNIFIDVQTNKMDNCSDSRMSDRYLHVLHKGTISCPGKDCYSSFVQKPVTWHKFKNDEIILSQVFDKDNGTYTCDYMVLDNNTWWKMRTVLNVNIISKSLSIDKCCDMMFYILSCTTLMQCEPLELNCNAQFGFEMNLWIRDDSIVICCRVNPKGLEDSLFTLVFKWTKVSEDDLNSSFLCLAQNSIGNSTGRIKLKRKTEKGKKCKVFFFSFFSFILWLDVDITAFGVFFGMVAYWQRIEIALLFRYYLAKDETVGDSKEFDAFVSYAKPDSPEHNQALRDEEQFALEILPQFLENKYGYKLCFAERDILPGGAYTDDIVNAIKRSRRAIMILSPNYVSGQALFELEAAVKTAFEDKTIKLILIQFEPFQEPQSVSQNVKKALKILPKIAWKKSGAPTANKKFWKKLQYHMPVKHTKGNGIILGK
uniref:Interleukin 18 receptor accessory protein n=1 Tax=Salvator merianae TaxID=96440 RepID=A0A8D0B9L8_SALMN